MKLLVATDFSVGAERALRRAMLLLSEVPPALRQMRLLHVVAPAVLHPSGGGGKPDDAERGYRASAAVQGLLAPLVHRVSTRSATDVTPVVVAGEARRSILEEAEQHRPDLTLVGLAGQSSLRRLVFGSTAEQLAMRTTQPLLIVKGPARVPYRRVLVPTAAADGVETSLSLARRLAPAAGIVLFHAYDVEVESQLQYVSVAEDVIQDARRLAHAAALQQLRDKRERAGPDHAGVALEAVRSHPAIAILDAERKHDCDLIVMMRHDASRVERFLLGSMTRRVLLHSRADVLVLPPNGLTG